MHIYFRVVCVPFWYVVLSHGSGAEGSKELWMEDTALASEEVFAGKLRLPLTGKNGLGTLRLTSRCSKPVR